MIVLSHAFSIKLSIKVSLQIIDLNGINPVKFFTTTQIPPCTGKRHSFLRKTTNTGANVALEHSTSIPLLKDSIREMKVITSTMFSMKRGELRPYP